MSPERQRTGIETVPEIARPAIPPFSSAQLLEQEEEGVTNAILEALENLNPNTKKAYARIWSHWNQWGTAKGYPMESKGVIVTGPRLNLFLNEWLSKQVVGKGRARAGQPYSFSYQEQYLNSIKKLFEIQVMVMDAILLEIFAYIIITL